MYIVFAGGRPELCAIVHENKSLILGLQVNMNNHIRLSISGNIAELQRNRRQITTLPEDIIRNNVTLGTGWIASWKLNHNRLAIQINGDKVTGMEGTITSVSNHGVCLIGTRITIADIMSQVPTGQAWLSCRYQREEASVPFL